MEKIRFIHDREGDTLTIWFGDPQSEDLSELTDDEVLLMKDGDGIVIGMEILHFSKRSPEGLPLAAGVGVG